MKMIKGVDGKQLLYRIKEDEQLDSLVLLLHPAVTPTTAELDPGIPAAASTHAEDPWQKLGAQPTAVLISMALVPKPWTVACEAEYGSKHKLMKPAAK